MSTNRRSFIAGTAATLLAARARSESTACRAIAFDAFPIFDPRPIAAACERMFPGRGAALAAAWRARQFDYQWLRALGGKYADFWDCTADALTAACATLGADVSAAQHEELMAQWLQLDVWPDVPPALRELRGLGLKLAILSNATPRILGSGLKRAGLESSFDHVISTDFARTCKPDPRAYQFGCDIMKLRREEILFVAFAGWDVAGAKWFGYSTFWNNRANAATERLGAVPDGVGVTLEDLLRFVGNK